MEVIAKKSKKKVMTQLNELQEVKEELLKGWKTENGIVPWSKIEDNHLEKIEGTLQKRDEKYITNRDNANHEIFLLQEKIDKAESRIESLLKEIEFQQKRKDTFEKDIEQQEKYIEIAETSLVTNTKLYQECQEEIGMRKFDNVILKQD